MFRRPESPLDTFSGDTVRGTSNPLAATDPSVLVGTPYQVRYKPAGLQLTGDRLADRVRQFALDGQIPSSILQDRRDRCVYVYCTVLLN